jgi:DNA repair protein RadA/Sms
MIYGAVMVKARSHFVCQSCGAVHSRWSGQCSACEQWDTLVEETTDAPPQSMGKGKATAFEITSLNADITPAERFSTKNAELDRVLGGGFVKGAAVLIGGDPGIGKSTLLLQISAKMSRDVETLYISGEESVAQIQLRAQRLELTDAPVQLASVTSVRDIVSAIKKLRSPALVVIDSIQTMYIDTIDSAPGTVSQVRSCAAELIRATKKQGITLVLVGHVTKEGQLAGPRVLEHMVDAVLYFEGDRSHLYRLLRGVKNRYGAVGEVGVFSMGERGLQQVANPSALFLSNRTHDVSGAAIYAGLEGSRPVLLELEALVAPSHYATPRRAVVGWDSGRLAMLLAVLESRAGMVLADREVYLNVAGGYKVNDPSADAPAAAALISAFLDVTLPSNAVLFGEIGLSGDIRAVPHTSLRLKEIAKLGFEQAIIPHQKKPPAEVPTGLKIITVKHINDVIDWIKAQ